MKKLKESAQIIYKNRLSFIGSIILMMFVAMIVFAYLVPDALDTEVRFTERFQLPSLKHPLGTDHRGWDIFLQLVYGSKEVLVPGFLAAVFSIIIGFTIGSISGLIGGWIDGVLMFITNIFLTIPPLPLQLILSTMIKIDNAVSLALMLSIFMWAGFARIIRAHVFSLKRRDFIKVLRMMNIGYLHILFKEVMPNLFPAVIMSFVGSMRAAIVATMGIMMLGLAPYSYVNWSVMMGEAVRLTAGVFNPSGLIYLFSPIVCMVLFHWSSLMFCIGLNEIVDPRLRYRNR